MRGQFYIGGNRMWWMLLLALEGGTYRAEIVVRSEEQCLYMRTSEEDLCVPVQVSFPKEQEKS